MINHRNNERNVIDMNDIASHLRNEFRARFPIPAIDMTFHDNETITVSLISRDIPEMRISYVCDVNSDDDYFVFINDDELTPICIAIPTDD